MSHYRNECSHGVLVSQCRCPAKDKTVRIVACPPHCHTASAERDDLYLHLHGAREHLCLAQMHVPHGLLSDTIERAIQSIDRVGSTLPQWSAAYRTHLEEPL